MSSAGDWGPRSPTICCRTGAWHQGNAYGSICGLFYDPETRTGFALLTNGALGQRNAAGVFRLNEDTAQAVYAAFFGLEREEPDCDPPALEAAC